MSVLNFGGVEENVITRDEFSLQKAREVLKSETIAVIGYGVQGPGQSDSVGQRQIRGQSALLRPISDSRPLRQTYRPNHPSSTSRTGTRCVESPRS